MKGGHLPKLVGNSGRVFSALMFGCLRSLDHCTSVDFNVLRTKSSKEPADSRFSLLLLPLWDRISHVFARQLKRHIETDSLASLFGTSCYLGLSHAPGGLL